VTFGGELMRGSRLALRLLAAPVFGGRVGIACLRNLLLHISILYILISIFKLFFQFLSCLLFHISIFYVLISIFFFFLEIILPSLLPPLPPPPHAPPPVGGTRQRLLLLLVAARVRHSRRRHGAERRFALKKLDAKTLYFQ
jgi:hypothetical protein